MKKSGYSLILWCLNALAAAAFVAGCASDNTAGQTQAAAGNGTPKNIIILFADGTAPTQWEFGRYSSVLLRQQSFAAARVVHQRLFIPTQPMQEEQHGPRPA